MKLIGNKKDAKTLSSIKLNEKESGKTLSQKYSVGKNEKERDNLKKKDLRGKGKSRKQPSLEKNS